MSDLEGITVVALEQAVAAPYASGRLADAGARVIKVERTGGDFARTYDRLVLGQSAYFVWLNRGKESVCLDLTVVADRNVLESMIARADVFLQNLRPGSLAKLGLDSASLRQRYSRLITCDISGFGNSGPRAGLKAYDLIVQGETGLCAITGTADGPARVGVSVCDIAAGMTAHSAILQALFARERTGRGKSIQVSLFDSVADWMNVPLLQYLYGKVSVQRAGVSHPTIAPYGAYQCQGGKRIILSVQNEREWRKFCEEFLGRADVAADPRFKDNTARVANRAALDELTAGVFAGLTESGACERLERAGIAYGRLNDLATAAEHPHLRFVSVETPGGEVRVVAPAAMFDAAAPQVRPVPGLDEHGAAIRAEFGA